MPIFRFRDYELDVERGELRRNGVLLKLQKQPFDILSILVSRAPEVVTRKELRDALWSEDVHVDFEHSIHRSIAKLRETLDDSPETPQFILTVPRRGYRFIAACERDDGASPSETPVAVEPLVDVERSGSVRRRPLLMGIVSAGLLALALLYALHLRGNVRVAHPLDVAPARSGRAFPEYAFAAGFDSGKISRYRVARDSGRLEFLGVVPAGRAPISAAVAPNAPFLFVADNLSAELLEFWIDRPTGNLTPVRGSPYSVGTNPRFVLVDGQRSLVYVANESSASISVFRMDPQNGALREVAGSPFAAGLNPNSLLLSGDFLYSANTLAGNIGIYQVEKDGTLRPTAHSPFYVGGQIRSLAMHPSGRYLYAAEADNDLYALLVDRSTGDLKALPPTKLELPFRRDCPRGLIRVLAVTSSAAVSDSGKFLYVTRQDCGIAGYRIDEQTGKLTLLAHAPFPTGSYPDGIKVLPGDQGVYLANQGTDDLFLYSVDSATGDLQVREIVPTEGEALSLALYP